MFQTVLKKKNQEGNWKKKRKKEMQQHFLQKSTSVTWDFGDWKRQSNKQEKNEDDKKEVKEKVISKVKNGWRDRRKNKMLNNRKWQVAKWRERECIKENRGTVKDIIKIRLPMLESTAYYRRKCLDKGCPMC